MQLLTSQKNFLVLSICIPKQINGIISEVQLWKKNSFLVLTSGKFLEALGSGIGTGSNFLPFIFTFEQGVLPQIKLQPNICQYPLINYLVARLKSPNDWQTEVFHCVSNLRKRKKNQYDESSFRNEVMEFQFWEYFCRFLLCNELILQYL